MNDQPILHQPARSSLSEIIKQQRKLQSLSMVDLSNKSGVPVERIEAIENCEASTNIDELVQFVFAFQPTGKDTDYGIFRLVVT